MCVLRSVVCSVNEIHSAEQTRVRRQNRKTLCSTAGYPAIRLASSITEPFCCTRFLIVELASRERRRENSIRQWALTRIRGKLYGSVESHRLLRVCEQFVRFVLKSVFITLELIKLRAANCRGPTDHIKTKKN